MRILFLSKEGDGLGLGHKLAVEGHHVDYYIKEERFKRAGNGIVRRVPSWRTVAERADLVIADMVGFGLYEDLFVRLRKPTLCVSALGDKLELDRKRAMDLFAKLGIAIPETKPFGSPQEARKYIESVEWRDGFVLKPDGNKATSKTQVVHDKEHLDFCIDRSPPSSLIVQRIVKGVEVSTEGWWNGRGFIRPFNHTFEEKRFLVGGLGPNTGCMGNVVVAYKDSKLTESTVERLAPFLRDINYRGPIDLNAICNESGAFVLEATARFGYDAIEALVEGLREPIGDLLFECATGTKKEMKVESGFMAAVRLSVPPWPQSKPGSEDYGEPIVGLGPEVLKHVALTDCYREGGRYFSAGGDGVLLKATATGRDTKEALNRCYRTLKNVSVGSAQYRADIGKRVEGDLAKLKGWGWL